MLGYTTPLQLRASGQHLSSFYTEGSVKEERGLTDATRLGAANFNEAGQHLHMRREEQNIAQPCRGTDTWNLQWSL